MDSAHCRRWSLSEGIQIEGVGTWIIATLIVWAGTLRYDKVIASARGCLSGTGRSPP